MSEFKCPTTLSLCTSLPHPQTQWAPGICSKHVTYSHLPDWSGCCVLLAMASETRPYVLVHATSDQFRHASWCMRHLISLDIRLGACDI